MVQRPAWGAALWPVDSAQLSDRDPWVLQLRDRPRLRLGGGVLLALRRPAVSGVGHEVADPTDRGLIAAHCRPATVPHPTQVAEPFISQMRAPLPRIPARISRERTHLMLTTVHR